MSSKRNDQFLAIFGTEFADLEDEAKDSVSKKPLRVEDQVVTDEKGRRRFHGAFTGGFSAGYFNTVGTKEGWIPATFVSSRAERADNESRRPEDFMDADDLGEYGIAPRRIRAKKEFIEEKPTEESTQKRRLAWDHSELIAETSGLADLIKPIGDSIGIQLLKKLGWRPGQGIGAKMSKRALEKQRRLEGDAKREGATTAEINAMAPGFMFAPGDVNVEQFESKTDLHGLGYEGLDAQSILKQTYGQKVVPQRQTGRNKTIKGQAFGVGVYEEDDEDVYNSEDLANYDFELGATTSGFDDKFGAITDDFIGSQKSQTARKFYPPPKLPRDFNPNHQTQPMGDLPQPLQEYAERMNVVQRAQALGEKPSVMLLLKDDDRRRLEEAKSQRDKPKVKMEPPKPKMETKPFSDDPKKQKRFEEYELYLKRGLNLPQPVDLTDWEWEKEVSQFQTYLSDELKAILPEMKARKLPLAKPEVAQPFAHLLKSKFTHANFEEDDVKQEAQESDRIEAVKMKMFGPLTREKFEWHPDRQMCKKFNIPNPYPDTNLTGVPGFQKPSTSKEMFILGMEMLPSTAQELANKREQQQQTGHLFVPKPGDSLSAETSQILLISTDTHPESEMEPERPPIDLFKTIFAESGTEEESEESEESENEEKVKTEPITLLEETMKIYGVDKKKFEIPLITLDDEEPEICIIPKPLPVFEELKYGPALPPAAEGPSLPSTGVIARYREKESKESKEETDEKHKHRHKHKKHKKKSKHKKDKKTKRKHEKPDSDSEISISSLDMVD